MIVGNPTLAEMCVFRFLPLTISCILIVPSSYRSVKYKLPEKLRLHPAQAITLRASTNIQGSQLLSP